MPKFDPKKYPELSHIEQRMQWFRDSFLEFDFHTYEYVNQGCTVNAAMIEDKLLYVANAGDSRTIIGKNGKVF
jgi:serine/threonine protein phosphatase PrpC